MAKKKGSGGGVATVTAAPVDSRPLLERVTDWVKEQGSDPGSYGVDKCLEAFPRDSESTVRQYHLMARKKLGLTKARPRFGTRNIDTDENQEITLTELYLVRDMGDSLEETLKALEAVDGKFGSLTRAKKAIEAYKQLNKE